MKKLEQCDPPAPEVLATYDQGGRSAPYISMIIAQQAYWQRMYAEAERNASSPESVITANISHTSKAMLDESFMALLEEEDRKARGEGDLAAYERHRIHTLGMTAVSMLVRRFRFSDTATVEDGLGVGSANFIFDVYKNPYHQPQSARLHMLPAAAEIVLDMPDERPSAWYGSGQLYVEYSSAAKPTAEQLHVIAERDIAVDFESLVTLTPHLIRREQ